MSKTADIISCLVSGSLLAGIGWMFVTVSQLPPPPVEDTSLFTVDAETYDPRRDDNVDRMIICSGGGNEDYEPQGPTMLAGVPEHRC